MRRSWPAVARPDDALSSTHQTHSGDHHIQFVVYSWALCTQHRGCLPRRTPILTQHPIILLIFVSRFPCRSHKRNACSRARLSLRALALSYAPNKVHSRPCYLGTPVTLPNLSNKSKYLPWINISILKRQIKDKILHKHKHNISRTRKTPKLTASYATNLMRFFSVQSRRVQTNTDTQNSRTSSGNLIQLCANEANAPFFAQKNLARAGHPSRHFATEQRSPMCRGGRLRPFLTLMAKCSRTFYASMMEVRCSNTPYVIPEVSNNNSFNLSTCHVAASFYINVSRDLRSTWLGSAITDKLEESAIRLHKING